MLKDSFFSFLNPDSLQSQSDAEGAPIRYRVTVRLNPDHPIFKGHFPGNPVVPGVCLIRMVTEIISAVTLREMFLREADNIKFLSPVNPFETPVLDIELTISENNGQTLSCQAQIKVDDLVKFRYKSMFIPNLT